MARSIGTISRNTALGEVTWAMCRPLSQADERLMPVQAVVQIVNLRKSRFAGSDQSNLMGAYLVVSQAELSRRS